MNHRSARPSRFRARLTQARALAARAVAVALPNRCALCGHLSASTICADCDAAYWNDARSRCVVCAVPFAPGRGARMAGYHCDACRVTPPPFDATFALADYRAPVDGLARALKFRAQLALGAEFAGRLARLVDDAHGERHGFDVIAPVPLARGRLAARGYNQAWAIARPLGLRLGVRAAPALLVRRAETVPQSRLDMRARRDNVGAAFAVAQGVAGRHVALVDDVMTSGATLAAAAHALKTAGARRVTNLVALRTARE